MDPSIHLSVCPVTYPTHVLLQGTDCSARQTRSLPLWVVTYNLSICKFWHLWLKSLKITLQAKGNTSVGPLAQ